MKTGICISDMHCGHLTGLTPPPWQLKEGGWRDKFVQTQQACWNWFVDEIASLPKPDVLLCNGDAVDGKGFRSGGTEQITTDMIKQGEIASHVIKKIMGKNTKLVMSFGTPYHTGNEEDWEGLVAKDCGAVEIGGHVWVDIEGVIFDMKHKIGSSGIPHGRSTAINREKLWGKMWEEAAEQPKSDVFIRSHVHYAEVTWNPDLGYGMVTPALQAFGSKYGSRQCSGRVHFGFYSFTVDKGVFTYRPHIAKLKVHQSKAVQI